MQIKNNELLRANADLNRGKLVNLFVDGRSVVAYLGETVAAALCAAGILTLGTSSKTGASRGMYCGMGLCFNCRMIIDGKPNMLACQTSVWDGMEIETQKGLGKWKKQ